MLNNVWPELQNYCNTVHYSYNKKVIRVLCNRLLCYKLAQHCLTVNFVNCVHVHIKCDIRVQMISQVWISDIQCLNSLLNSITGYHWLNQMMKWCFKPEHPAIQNKVWLCSTDGGGVCEACFILHTRLEAFIWPFSVLCCFLLIMPLACSCLRVSCVSLPSQMDDWQLVMNSGEMWETSAARGSAMIKDRRRRAR